MVPMAVKAATSFAVDATGLPNGQFPNAPVKASSTAKGIVKLTLTASQASQTLTSVTVAFSGTGFTESDLLAPATGSGSGVLLYDDTGTIPNQFDALDAVQTLAGGVAWGVASGTITLTPATPIALTSGTAKVFYIAFRTSATVSNNDQIIATIGSNMVVTSDGGGPTATFASSAYRADTVAPTITSVQGFVSSTAITVMFSEAVEAQNGGNIAFAQTPFSFTDGGGTAQAISALTHTLGMGSVALTLDSSLEPADVDGSPATVAANLNKISDMAGNVVDTTAVGLSSMLSISTTAIPSATAGTVYTADSPLVALTAVGNGAGTAQWSLTDATSTVTMGTLGLALNAATGKITGTVANVSGSFYVSFTVGNGTATATRGYNINVAPAGGGGVPGISSVNPTGGIQNSTVAMTVTGANTSFSGTSQVEFLLPVGVAGINGITVNSIAANGNTSLSFNAAVASNASTGTRDLKITSGSQVVTLPNAFSVLTAGGSGLTLLLPGNNMTNVQMPPGFSFLQSSDTSVQSYRLTVKTGSDPTNTLTPIWDYVLSSASTGGLCTTTQCNVTYGNGQFKMLTQPAALSSNTDYYWQVRSYATGTQGVSTSTAALETSPSNKFTTVATVSDVSGPSIFHQPVYKATASTALKMYARVFDNIATPSTNPALTAKIFYCAGSGCDPTTQATGTSLGGGYFSFSVPTSTIGVAGTIVRYHLQGFDGFNTTNFKQSDATPFQLTSQAAGASTITGTVKDSTDACSAGVQGALVFAGGTGFSATTNGSCQFTLSGLYAGTYNIFAGKDGYSELSINGVPAGTSNVALKLTQGAGGGFGGNTTKPKVKFTGPADGMTGMPGNDSNFKIFLVFDTTMNQGSITLPGNLIVKEINPGSGTSTDITNKGAWTYYPTAPTAAGLPAEANMAAWALASGQTIGDGKTIVVQAANAITNTAGNTLQGNQPDGSYAFSFTTGASFMGSFGSGETFGAGSFVPPHVKGSTPAPGSYGVAKNTPMIMNFSEAMTDDSGSYMLKDYIKLTLPSGSSETDISVTAIDTVSLDTTKLIAKITLKNTYNSGAFASDTKYRLKILGGAKAASGLTLGPPGSGSSVMYAADFTTGSTTDTSKPSIVGVFPDNGATNVPVNVGTINTAFSKDLDAATVTTNSYYLSLGSQTVDGSVEYRPLERTAVFKPKNALEANTSYLLSITSGIQGLNGSAVTSTTKTFTTGAADGTAPSLSFINADEYNVALTFSEPMNSAKVVDTMNWASSVLNAATYDVIKYGPASFNVGSAGTVVSLTGATFSYDAMSSTVTIKGLAIPSSAIGQELYVSLDGSGDNVPKDLSGNAISGTGLSARAKILSSSNTKGALGPMAMTTDSFSSGGGFTPTNFSSTDFGFAPPIEVRPFNTMAGITTIYGVRLPISQQIPSGGTVVLTFPSGFDVSGAKQDVNSPMRTDLNGMSAGAPTFKCGSNNVGSRSCASTANADDTSTAQGGLADDGVVVNATARTVTIYLSAATNSGGKDFLTIDIAGIKNSTVPKDFNTSGYTVDVKTMNGSTLLESLTSSSFFIQAAGTNVLNGTITATGNDQSGTMKVYLMSPMTGPLETTTTDFTSSTTATYTFSSLPSGNYMLFTDQVISLNGGGTTKEFQGKSIPEGISISQTTTTYNFTLGQSSATGTTVTLNITGPASEPLDVFAGSPTGFRVKQVTLDATTSTVDTVTLNLPDGNWFLGIGPQMPKGFGGGPPPATKYLPPKPKNVTVSGSTCTVDGTVGCTIAFTLSTASKIIQGIVKDGTGKIMANAEVYAYSPQGGMGTHGQTGTDGTFTLSVTEGSYIVGSFVPGMPPSKEIPVIVTSDASAYLLIDGATTAITPAAAASSFVLRVAKPDYTISGKVTDGTNVVQGASVYAYRTDGPGHANAITGSAGTYTLYVSNGTWKVGSFLPQYGHQAEQTVTINGSSASNINFSPSQTGTFYSVSGRVYTDTNADGDYDAGEEKAGSFVKINGNGTFNEAIANASGTYSFNVPSGNGYTLRAFVPGIGETAPLAAFNVAANVTDKDFRVTPPKTVSIIFSDVVVESFVDAYTATGTGAHVNLKNGTSTSLSLPVGAYKINVFVSGANIGSSDVAGTTADTAFNTATGILTVDGNESLTVTLPTLRTVSGVVTNGSASVTQAWVEITKPGTPIHIGTQTDSNGAFSLKVADSATAYSINAMKPGFFRQPSPLTVNGANPDSQTLVMSAATLSISGRITAGNATASNAFVRAEKQGGGFAGTQADANGDYTLYVTAGQWRVFGVAEGYAEGEYSGGAITISTASVTGKNINLSTTVSLNPPKTKPITPASGGTLEDSTAGVKLTFPANALGSDTNAGNVQAKETNNVRETSSAYPLGGKAKEFKATDADGNPITNFNDDVTVAMDYTVAQLAASKSSSDSSINTKTETDSLKMGYWDETTSNWVTMPSTVTYKDANGNTVGSPAADLSNVTTVTISANTTHFSLYAPIVSTDPNAPSTPTGFAATAASASQINLSWTVVSGATSYDIYRSTTSDGTFTRLGSEPTVSSGSTTSYQDTGLSANSIYYYKISSLNDSGESTSTSAVSAQTQQGGSSNSPGGGGLSAGSGGGSSGGSTSGQTPSVTQPAPTTPTVTPTTPAPVTTTPSAPSVTVPNAPSAPQTTPAAPSGPPTPSSLVVEKKGVTFSGVPFKSDIVQNTPYSYSYAYRNGTNKTEQVEVVRRLLDSQGKVITTSKGTAIVKAGGTFSRKVTEVATVKMAPGGYKVSVTVNDKKTKKILASGAFTFTVAAKPTPKWVPPAVSKVKFTSVPAASLKLGNALRYGYQYKNEGKTSQRITVVRKETDAAGRTMVNVSGAYTLRAGQVFSRSVSSWVTAKYKPGKYTVTLTVLDAATGKVISTATASFEVKK